MSKFSSVETQGTVGVDAGQVLIIDPMVYIENWTDEDFSGHPKFQHRITKEIFHFPSTVSSYQEMIPSIGKNLNQLIRDNEVDEIERKAENDLSYNSCCLNQGKVLGDKLGFNTSSGFGDGSYEVYRMMSNFKDPVESTEALYIDFIMEEDEDSEDFSFIEKETKGKPVGEIEVKSGVIMFSDPCYETQIGRQKEGLLKYMQQAKEAVEGNVQMNYDLGHAGLGVMCAVKNGTYQIFPVSKDMEDFGERVTGVFLKFKK